MTATMSSLGPEMTARLRNRFEEISQLSREQLRRDWCDVYLDRATQTAWLNFRAGACNILALLADETSR